MTILVTGASGTVGSELVRILLAAGETVRAMSRHRLDTPAETVVADLSRPESIPWDGVDRMFLFPVAGTASEVVARAAAGGVRRIVTLSSGAVTSGDDTGFHLEVENAVEASGLEWTHVRPGEFAMNKLRMWGQAIRADRIVREPSGEFGWYPTHERDIAEVAALALTHDGHHGRAYTFGGPQYLTLRQQADAIAAAIGETIRFEEVTPARARELYLAQGGFAAEVADMMLGFTDYGGSETDPDTLAERAAALTPDEPATAAPITGRARSFTEWARDHAEDFR